MDLMAVDACREPSLALELGHGAVLAGGSGEPADLDAHEAMFRFTQHPGGPHPPAASEVDAEVGGLGHWPNRKSSSSDQAGDRPRVTHEAADDDRFVGNLELPRLQLTAR
eukprot:1798950-Pyramimonas_sp.AAC.1